MKFLQNNTTKKSQWQTYKKLELIPNSAPESQVIFSDVSRGHSPTIVNANVKNISKKGGGKNLSFLARGRIKAFKEVVLPQNKA